MYKLNYDMVQRFAEDLFQLNQDKDRCNEVEVIINSQGIWIQAKDAINNTWYPTLFIEQTEE